MVYKTVADSMVNSATSSISTTSSSYVTTHCKGLAGAIRSFMGLNHILFWTKTLPLLSIVLSSSGTLAQTDLTILNFSGKVAWTLVTSCISWRGCPSSLSLSATHESFRMWVVMSSSTSRYMTISSMFFSDTLWSRTYQVDEWIQKILATGDASSPSLSRYCESNFIHMAAAVSKE